ncbi:MAG: glycosyltransferase family 2 protein [Gammaproteobacteria bacterium]|nr:glycosyltransferase family 2 protein [Gammaproteobacteria bacterium]
MEISVIVPFYNEEACIEDMYNALIDALDPTGHSFELLFVDDGSKDGTFTKAREIALKDSRLRVVKFRRNYGQTPAMAAGIDHAQGRILVTMDGDLQNDPADIPLFLEKMDEGYDIVVGWRHNRQDKLITRKIPSKIANWIIGKVTGVPIKDNGCSLKAYRADLIKKIPLYSEMHRFIPAMASLSGVKIAEIKVNHNARTSGVSKYGLSRIYKVLLDLLTIKTIVSFSSRPLIWFGILGLAAGFISFIAFIFSLVLLSSGGAAVAMMGVSVLFGFLMVFLMLSGVLCELIYKTGNQKIEDLSCLTSEIVSLTEVKKS